MSKSTLNAFLSRGIDSKTADKLITLGHTLGELKTITVKQLKDLKIPASIISSIRDESRPSIPSNTVIKLLYESKRVCCICRDLTKSIIIHHISEWSKSRDHSEQNLVVLCLHHHDEAHSKKELGINLSKSQIIKLKNKWLSEVKTQDAKTILGLVNNHSRWDYVNIKRLFELFIDSNIDFENIKSFPTLRYLNIVDKNGILTPIDKWDIKAKPSWHLCDFGEGIYLGHYLKEITENLVSNFPLIDLTNNLNAKFIKSVVNTGSIITGQLGFYFTDIDKFEHVDDKLNKQLRKAYYKGSSIKIEFIFDASECTSSSGRFDALTGHKVAIPIVFVRSILEDEENNLVITGSCLAIGTWFDNHREKDY